MTKKLTVFMLYGTISWQGGRTSPLGAHLHRRESCLFESRCLALDRKCGSIYCYSRANDIAKIAARHPATFSRVCLYRTVQSHQRSHLKYIKLRAENILFGTAAFQQLSGSLAYEVIGPASHPSLSLTPAQPWSRAV